MHTCLWHSVEVTRCCCKYIYYDHSESKINTLDIWAQNNNRTILILLTFNNSRTSRRQWQRGRVGGADREQAAHSVWVKRSPQRNRLKRYVLNPRMILCVLKCFFWPNDLSVCCVEAEHSNFHADVSNVRNMLFVCVCVCVNIGMVLNAKYL